MANTFIIDANINDGYPSIDSVAGDKSDSFEIDTVLYLRCDTSATNPKKEGYPIPYTEKPFSEVQEAPYPAAMLTCDPNRMEGYPAYADSYPFEHVQTLPYPYSMMSCDPNKLEGYPVYVHYMPFQHPQTQPYPYNMMSCASDQIEGYPNYRRSGKSFKDFGAGYKSTLEEIEIPYSVKYISDYAFWGTDIKSVKINRHCIYYAHSFPEGCHIKPYKDE